MPPVHTSTEDPFERIPEQDRKALIPMMFGAMIVAGLADGPMNHHERDAVAWTSYAALRWAKTPQQTLADVQSLVEAIDPSRPGAPDWREGLKPVRRLSAVGRRHVLQAAVTMARIDGPISAKEELVLLEIARSIMVPSSVLEELQREQDERDSGTAP